MHKLYLTLLHQTGRKDLNRLAKSRSLPIDAIELAGFAYDKDGQQFILPIYNRNDSLANLKTYPLAASGKKRRFYNTPAPVIGHLYNSQRLRNSEDTILICEGEWDAISLEYTLSKLPTKSRPKVTVVGVPGAHTTSSIFTDRIIKLLLGKKVCILYDHDEAGKKGTAKLIKHLTSQGIKNIHSLKWPDSYPDKYDVGDHITKSKLSPESVWEDLSSWLEPVASANVNSTSATVKLVSEAVDIEPRVHYDQVVTDFREKGVHIDKQFEGGIAVAAAAAISNPVPGDPIWMFLVGPSSSGKSLILDATLSSKNCIYRTSTYYRDLVSGYKGEGEENTTLLYDLLHHCFVIKDYTTILTMPPSEKQHMDGLLREVYDGRINLSYGNGKTISMEGTLSILAGCTHKIHGVQNSNLGERFLKYEIAPPQKLTDDLEPIRTAIDGGADSADDVQNKAFREASFSTFLDNKVNSIVDGTAPEVTIPQHIKDQIGYLAQFGAACRSVVERDRHGALEYDASSESGRRLAKQLISLARALSYVYGVESPNERILELLRKIAWDTAYSRLRKLYTYLYECEEDRGVTIDELIEATLYPRTTIRRVLSDMFELGVIFPIQVQKPKRGRPEVRYLLTDEARNLYQSCNFEG